MNCTLDLADLASDPIRPSAARIERMCRWCLVRGVKLAVNGRLRRRVRIRSFKLWEYARGLAFAPPGEGDRILEVGGSGSVFSYTLLKEGNAVRGLDLDSSLMGYARDVARRFAWPFETREVNLCLSEMPAEWGSFDRVYCFSVLEHIPVTERAAFLARLGAGLAKGGLLVLTFDYGEQAPTPGTLRDTAEVSQVVRETGLEPLEGEVFRDRGLRYAIDRKHPESRFTFGSLVLSR